MKAKLIRIDVERLGQGTVEVEAEDGTTIDLSHLCNGVEVEAAVGALAVFRISVLGNRVEFNYEREPDG